MQTIPAEKSTAPKQSKSRRGIAGKVLSYLLLFSGLVLILFPFYITLITAFKTQAQSAENFFSFPQTLYLDNFISVFMKAGYFTYFRNSALVTLTSVFGIFLFSPMCAYAISRNMHRRKYYKLIYFYLLSGIFVPFQVIMVPLVKYMGMFHLNSRAGLIILHITLASSQAIFLLVNYIRSIPADLEEAAAIDGCGTFRVYWSIVLPLIRPMTMTIMVLNTLWVWNDFQMPLLILNRSPDTWTLPLFQYNFKSQYTFDYNMAFASYLVAMVPVMIVYAFAQRYIVAGLTQGAVKS